MSPRTSSFQDIEVEPRSTGFIAATESDRGWAAPRSSVASLGARTFSLDLPSCVQTIDAVDAFAGEVAAFAGLDPESTRDVQIAVHEAVINAIVHGNGRDESRRVRLELTVGPTGLAVCVRDQGAGFDLSGVPDPLAPHNLCKPCGRGILFMRSLMDEVSFGPAADGGTQVRMVRRRAHVAQATSPERVPRKRAPLDEVAP
jgi:serine/threonine-protein kinase RsbW